MKPASGEGIIGTTTFGHNPVCRLSPDQLPCAVAPAAPLTPPIKAWLELDGRPPNQVIMFQLNAAINAHKTVANVTAFVSTNPLPIVDATAPPNNAPVRLKKAAIAIACRGVKTLVDTTVAMALAAS